MLGRSEVWLSRPWDLTEIVPVQETLWFRAGAVIAAGIVMVVLLVVLLS
jgi:hypothetical protein